MMRRRGVEQDRSLLLMEMKIYKRRLANEENVVYQ